MVNNSSVPSYDDLMLMDKILIYELSSKWSDAYVISRDDKAILNNEGTIIQNSEGEILLKTDYYSEHGSIVDATLKLGHISNELDLLRGFLLITQVTTERNRVDSLIVDGNIVATYVNGLLHNKGRFAFKNSSWSNPVDRKLYRIKPPLNAKVNINGQVREVTKVFANVNGQKQEVVKMFANINGKVREM